MADELDSLKDNSSSWGGSREGAGRPKGSMNESSKQRMEVKQKLQERITAHVDRLFAAQMSIAEGTSMLFRIEKDEKGNKKKPELVTDEYTIQRFIDECGGYEGTMDDDTYYFITTKIPDNKAIDSMLDRAFGKADSKLDMTTNGKDLPTPILGGITKNVSSDNSDPEAS